MSRNSLAVIFGGVTISLLLLGCAHRVAATGPGEAKKVMDAQRTAKSDATPMSGAEADAIYKNYVANIGKPVKPTSSLDESNTR